MKSKHNFWLAIGCLFFIILGIIISRPTVNKEFSKYDSYLLLKPEDSLNGFIQKILVSRGQSYIVLKDTCKIWLIHSRNYNYKPAWLDAFLKEGDEVIKRKNSDTLLIFRGDNTFYFLLGKNVGEGKILENRN